MDVQPETIGEQLLGDEEAVVGDDDDAGVPGELGQAVRLLDVEAVLEGDLLSRRRQLLAATPLRAVGLREEEFDLAARGETVEDPRSERPGRRDRDAHRPTFGL